MARIFISHSSRNNAEAAAIGEWLMAEGFDDFFLDFEPERGIAAGERWERALYDAADRCEAVIFLVSRDWLASDWCAREFDLAAKLSKRIFGVVIDDLPMSEIPVRYRRTWQLTSLSAGEDHRVFRINVPPYGSEAHATFSKRGLKRLKAGLFAAGLDPQYFAWPPARDPERAPYRGLEALEAEDAGIFFGREAPLIAALDRLRALAERAPPRLFVILGASGAGKSSFLKAGLWPRLERDDRHFLPLPVIRPSKASVAGMSGLISSLAKAASDLKLTISRADVTSAVESPEGTISLLKRLAETATAAPLPGEEPVPAPALVLCIDQAEELFPAPSRPEAEDLLSFLSLAARSAEVRVVVIFTIRSEFYGELQAASAFEGLAQDTFSLEPMPRGAFGTVIEGPARRLKDTKRELSIDPSLTDALLRDMEKSAGRDALPLLAFTLERIYREYSGKGVIRSADYEASGGVVGSIEAAVNEALTAARDYPDAPQEREAQLTLLRRGLIPWLAAIDPATGEPRRNAVRRKSLPVEALPLIDRLIDARLLLSYGYTDASDGLVEPAHDALLRQWPVMVAWLKEDMARLTVMANLKEATRDWGAHGRHEGWLAHRGGRLEDAEALRERPDLMAFLDGHEASYLTACRRKEDADRNRELNQARAEKEASEKVAEAERRGRRRAVAGLAAAAAFAILALGAASAAFFQLKSALANDSTALASLSLSAAKDGNNNDALILALASWPRRNWLEMRPKLQLSIEAISYALSSGRVARLQFKHDGAAAGAVLIRGERRLVSWSDDGTVRLWDVATGAQIGPAMKHDKSVNGAVLNGDETRIMSWSDDGTVRLWNMATGAQIGSVMKHDGSVIRAVLTRDERRIISWSSDKTLRLWDTATGAQIGPAIRHRFGRGSWVAKEESEVYGMLLSHDQSRILSWAWGETLHLWEAATGAQIEPVMQHNEHGNILILPHDRINGAVLSRDDSRILSWSSDSTMRLWDAATGAQIGPAMKHDESVNGAVLNGNETRILSWSDDGTVRLWDVATGAQIGPAMKPDSSAKGAMLTRDETRIISWSDDGTVRLWDVATGAQIGAAMKHDKSVNGAVLNGDETRIMSWSDDGTVRLWDAATGAQIGQVMKHGGRVYGAELTQDNRRILSWSEDGTVRLWDVVIDGQMGPIINQELYLPFLTRDKRRLLFFYRDETLRLWDTATGMQIGPVIKYDRRQNGAALTRDQTRIISWSDDGAVRLWDVATGAQIGPAMKHDKSINGAVLTRDETRIISWSDDGAVRLWDVATGAQIGSAMKHDNSVNGAVLNGDETRILSWSDDGTVRLWETATGAQIGPSMKHDKSVNGAVLTGDESQILFWSMDGTVRLWNVVTGAQIRPIMSHDPFVFYAMLTRDGSRILALSRRREDKEYRLQLWDSSTGAQVGQVMNHRGWSAPAVLNGDETRIMSWSDDGTVRLWDVATGAQIGPAMKHDKSINGAVLTRDETRIMSWSDDGTVRLWDVATGTQIRPAMKHDKSVNGAVLNGDETRIMSWSDDGTVRLWDVATGAQIGPAMKHDNIVSGAVLNGDETRILAWSVSGEFRSWHNWPAGNIIDLACSITTDHDVRRVSQKYNISISNEICGSGKDMPDRP